VRTHDCGYVVRYGDVRGLVGLCDSLVSHRADWEHKCANARGLYCREFQWEPEATRLRRFYEHLLAA
jgi:hypothetical protein